MKLKQWLEKWSLDSLKINAGFLDLEMSFKNADRAAAWELYIELLTRIILQPLEPDSGDEAAALTSVFSLFGTTRGILKHHGPGCIEFSKIAIVILNQVIRPFTAKWHKLSLEGKLTQPDMKLQFRKELEQVQKLLHNYAGMLSAIAEVEDLTLIEHNGNMNAK